jgi:hypothetical protein
LADGKWRAVILSKNGGKGPAAFFLFKPIHTILKAVVLTDTDISKIPSAMIIEA